MEASLITERTKIVAVTGIDYYRHTFPPMAEHGRRMVRAVIAELA